LRHRGIPRAMLWKLDRRLPNGQVHQVWAVAFCNLDHPPRVPQTEEDHSKQLDDYPSKMRAMLFMVLWIVTNRAVEHEDAALVQSMES
jgi:hypothetical protein